MFEKCYWWSGCAGNHPNTVIFLLAVLWYPLYPVSWSQVGFCLRCLLKCSCLSMKSCLFATHVYTALSYYIVSFYSNVMVYQNHHDGCVMQMLFYAFSRRMMKTVLWLQSKYTYFSIEILWVILRELCHLFSNAYWICERWLIVTLSQDVHDFHALCLY